MEDKLTLLRIELAHPVLRDELKQLYIECNSNLSKNIRLRFAYVFRTAKEQQELYDQGRTIPGNIVTNSKPGQSFHNYGLAFDIVLLYDKDGDGNFEEASWDIRRDMDNNKKADWLEVVSFFKAHGWIWGGDFKSFRDYPHFEKTFGFTWKQLSTMQKDDHGYVIF